MRNNPGGLLNESIDIVNLFVNQGEEIVSTKGKIKSWQKSYTARNIPLDINIPLVVLINSASASASEIVSGAIQDLDRGIVIGQRSFGKGLVQQTRKLSYNSQLKLTVAKYYIPSGRCIQAVDYSNRNDDGSVGKTPDSLRGIFYTRNGREVYDGGGIYPDIITEKKSVSNIVLSLYKERLFFDYATDFQFKNEKISSDYIISDAQYDDFVDYISNKDYSYETKTEEMLVKLKEKAIDERYFNLLKEEYEALELELKSNKKDDLFTNKDEIKEALSSEIVSRYYFQKGRIKTSLNFDIDLVEAIGILNDKDRYSQVLGYN